MSTRVPRRLRIELDFSSLFWQATWKSHPRTPPQKWAFCGWFMNNQILEKIKHDFVYCCPWVKLAWVSSSWERAWASGLGLFESISSSSSAGIDVNVQSFASSAPVSVCTFIYLEIVCHIQLHSSPSSLSAIKTNSIGVWEGKSFELYFESKGSGAFDFRFHSIIKVTL